MTVYFNMMDIQVVCWDWLRENCRRRYLETTGLNLPENDNDLNINDYRRFQRQTSGELYKKVTAFIKQQNPELIVYNYNDVGTSWIASESGASMSHGVDNIYSATTNVKRTLGSIKTEHLLIS
jgi:hypothetical protein